MKLERYTEAELAACILNHEDKAMARAKVVSRNLTRRLTGLPALTLPPKPGKVYVPLAFFRGLFAGRLYDIDDLPEGHKIRWEVAV